MQNWREMTEAQRHSQSMREIDASNLLHRFTAILK